LPKPALHWAIPHAPDWQLVVALFSVHGCAQPPQFVLVLSGASHPLCSSPSQFPHPALQEPMEQLPPEQTGLACGSAHAAPHAPQCPGVVLRLVSQPFCTIPSQFPNPALHVIPHCPTVHCAVPPAVEHPVAHVPQCAGSVCRFTSHPLFGFPSQSPSPGLHAMEHAPLLQSGVPVLPSHFLPHVPQLFTSLTSGVSQPLSAFPSQSPNPDEHTTLQCPSMHVAVPLAPMQAFPHWPQWFRSLEAFTSQPFTGELSQSLFIPEHPATSHAPEVHFQSITFSALVNFVAHSSFRFATSSTLPLQLSSLPLHTSMTDPGSTSGTQFRVPPAHCVLPEEQIPGCPV
jgi:hypothetical protein